MTKKRSVKKQEAAKTPFWKPETPGEAIEGVFRGYERTEKAVCMRIGNILISMSTVLHSFFKPVYRSMKAGKSKVKLVYIGLTDKKYYGHKARLFRVYLDGKELEQSFEAERLDTKGIDEFFAVKPKSEKD